VQPERVAYPDRAPSTNVIEFSEDTKSRRFRAEVSDTAIDSVSQPLALFLGSRLGKRAIHGQRQTGSPDEVVTFTADEIREYEDDQSPLTDSAKALPVSSDLEVLRRIFRRTNDNKLKLTDSRLKQNSQRDFVKRLTALFLLAHELEGNEAVARADLNAVLTDAKIHDSNAVAWINSTDILELDGNFVRLALPGRDYARKVLGDYLDPQIEGIWSFGSKSRRRSSKSRTSEVEGESEEGAKGRKGPRARGESYKAKVNMLLDSNFFADGRTDKEVQAELQRKGFKFELRRIREALVALTQKDRLTRNQNESNDWVYKNT
jgi:hypothetical protein